MEPYVWDDKREGNQLQLHIKIIIEINGKDFENMSTMEEDKSLFQLADSRKVKRNKIILNCKKSYTLENIKDLMFTEFEEEEEKTLENIRNNIFERASFNQKAREMQREHIQANKRDSIALITTAVPTMLNDEKGLIAEHDDEFDSDSEDVLVIKDKLYKEVVSENSILDYFK